MMNFWSFSNSTSSCVKYKLKTIKLRGRKIEKERVAIVKTRMNKRCSNKFSSVKIKSVANTSKGSMIHIHNFRNFISEIIDDTLRKTFANKVSEIKFRKFFMCFTVLAYHSLT